MRRPPAFALVIATMCLSLSVGSSALASGYRTTPRAHCGPGSLPETGLQGEVPLTDQLDGRSLRGYRCNLELVGRYEGNGAALMLAWYGHCAYVPTGYAPTDPEYAAKKGVEVLDVSDPRHPRLTMRLQTPAMVNPWEALKVSPRTGLLATGEGGSFPLAGPGASGPAFDVYDVKHDCAHPQLDASVDLPDAKGHEGDFSPDGRTYYESMLQASPMVGLTAVDLSDPTHPRELLRWTNPYGPIHAVQIADHGNRAYFMIAGYHGTQYPNGLVIADTSQIEERRTHPTIRVISHLFWRDGDEAQIGRLVHIGGHPYVVTTDEFGAGPNPHVSCAEGKNPYGFVHIIDVADEQHPRLVSRIRLQVNDPANCRTVLQEQNAALSLMYSSHYCTADDPAHTTAIACTWISSGVRVFDVRDPRHPREIAYYNPPAQLDPEAHRATSPVFDTLVGTWTKDATTTQVRWIRDPETGDEDLWFISSENGFQVLRFTNGAYPLTSKRSTPGRAPFSSPGGPANGSSGTSIAATGEPAAVTWVGLTVVLLALAGLGHVAWGRRSPNVR